MESTFPSTRPDPFPVLTRILPFSGTRQDSTLLRYSPGFYPSPVLAWIQPFLVLAPTLFQYSPRFYHFSVLTRLYPSPVLAWNLPFPILARALFSVLVQILPFSSSRSDSTLLRYLPGFYSSLVLARIPLFSNTHPDSFLVLAQILTFAGKRLDSTLLRYSPGFNPSTVLARILPFSGTHQDSTLIWYSLGFYLSPYSPGPFYGTILWILLCLIRIPLLRKQIMCQSSLGDLS